MELHTYKGSRTQNCKTVKHTHLRERAVCDVYLLSYLLHPFLHGHAAPPRNVSKVLSLSRKFNVENICCLADMKRTRPVEI